MKELQLPLLAALGSAEMAGEVKLAAVTVEIDVDVAVMLGERAKRRRIYPISCIVPPSCSLLSSAHA